MSHAISAPLSFDGETIAARADSVDVVVQRINAGSFRLSIRYAASGFEIDELSRSFPAEHTARRAARTATVLFRAGLTVRQALDLLTVFTVPAA